MRTILPAILLSLAAACGNSAQGVAVDAPTAGDAAALTAAERDRLTFLREEEKLARDVYDALDGNGQPFVNIQASEQRHMDAIKALLDTYGLLDPAATTAVGDFTDQALQALHDDLVARGLAGSQAALIVGCTIEDLDLRDLALADDETGRADLEATYAMLALGSRNHLRAFYGRLTAAGGSYTPQYLDRATFDAIVTSPHEQGAGKLHPPGHAGAGHDGTCGAARP
jgi:hypothetical protein